MFTARTTPSKIDWTTLNTLVAFHYGEVGNLASKFTRVEIKSYYHILKKTHSNLQRILQNEHF